MSTKQISSLEDVIQKWVDDNCEDIDVYWPDNIAETTARHFADTVLMLQQAVASSKDS